MQIILLKNAQKKGGDIVALYYKLLPKPIIIHLKS